MARVVYLHVGAPKTGARRLQDRLYRNRETLARYDVQYPVGVSGSMLEAAIDLVDIPWGGLREGAHGEWANLVGRVRRASGQVIISHEALAAAQSPLVARAMADLEPAEVHLVYSARDLARQIPAEWQDGVTHRRQKSFAKFLETVRRAPRRGARLWFWRVQGLPDVLNRWAYNLPPEHVHLVTVPQEDEPRDELWRRYCEAFRIDPAWAPEESRHHSESIGTAEAALIRRLNRRLNANRRRLPADDYRRLVRELVVHQTLARRQDMVYGSLPPEAIPWAEEVAGEWIDWVEGAGIDVIGDLDDLRPRRLEPGARWVDPDKPNQAHMVDAALDAIEVLLQESADPGRRTTTDLLVRAAQRLRPS
jgi:hypothetical protein